MLGYSNLKDRSVSGFFRFLAKVGDGMMKMQIVKIQFSGRAQEKKALDVYKRQVDESVHRIVAGGLQHAADLRDVRVQVGAGVLLLLKLSETAAALLDLFVALAVHFEKIRVRDLSGDIILEQMCIRDSVWGKSVETLVSILLDLPAKGWLPFYML